MVTKAKSPTGKSNLPKELEGAMHKALAALEGGHPEDAGKAFDTLAEHAAAAGHVALERVAKGYAAAGHARGKKTARGHADPLMELSLLLNQGESETALEKAEKAVKTHAGVAALHYLKASAMAQMGRYEESAEALKQAIKLNPDFGWTFRFEPDFARARTTAPFAAFERLD